MDEYGNVKIWVNSDLSINYPNNEGYIEYKQKGEEDMVDAIVNIIADNTDEETEPSPSFKYLPCKLGSSTSRNEGRGGRNSKKPKFWSSITQGNYPLTLD